MNETQAQHMREKLKSMPLHDLVAYCEAFNKIFRSMMVNGHLPLQPTAARQLQDAINRAKKRGLK